MFQGSERPRRHLRHSLYVITCPLYVFSGDEDRPRETWQSLICIFNKNYARQSPHLRHTAWSGILQRFFALALVHHYTTPKKLANFIDRSSDIGFRLSYSCHSLAQRRDYSYRVSIVLSACCGCSTRSEIWAHNLTSSTANDVLVAPWLSKNSLKLINRVYKRRTWAARCHCLA